MLVLSVNRGSSIIINGNIVVTLEKLSGNQAKISVAAPKDITIDREKIHLSKMNNPR